MLAYMYGLIYKSPGCNIQHACDDLTEQRAKLSLAVAITQMYNYTAVSERFFYWTDML